ncbi:hypothetical protein [Sorangium sp. So ce1000]|uniref:hypothetical protein n=1 Tax=Sorangium sp. So ce1000 TaxID=3133325 RepID=UPI003F61F5F5
MWTFHISAFPLRRTGRVQATSVPLCLVVALAGCSPKARSFQGGGAGGAGAGSSGDQGAGAGEPGAGWDGDVPACAVETQATDCDDGNPCTADACASGACVNVPIDGVPALPSGQIAGDCQILTCVAGQPIPAPDDADAEDDGDPCTSDACRGGIATHVVAAGSACGADRVCDAAGACRGANGRACAAPEDCASGRCVGGICCDTACDGICMACDVEGSVGTCSPLGPGVEDTPDCVLENEVCDGMGACKLAPGRRCHRDESCASGVCRENRRCGGFMTE